MHIYWHNLGLKLVPESVAERLALALLVANTKFGKPAELSIGQGLSEQFLHLGIVDHEVVPSTCSIQPDNQDTVVGIDAPVTSDLVA